MNSNTKVVLIVVGVVALLGAGFYFIFASDSNDPAETQYSILPVGDPQQQLAALDPGEAEAMNRYIRTFREQGWSEAEYGSAKSYINMPSRRSNRQQLQDFLTGNLLRVLDSIITRAYASNPSPNLVRNITVLRNNYAGLDKLAEEFPVIAGSSSYQRLDEDRKLFDKIYNFRQSSFVCNNSFRLRVENNANGQPTLNWGSLVNYSGYRQSQNSHRQQLLTELGRQTDIASIPWMSAALGESDFNTRITQGEVRYINNEKLALSRTLTEINADTTLWNNTNARRTRAALNALKANLPQALSSEDIMARINRVVSDHPETSQNHR